MTAKVVVAVRVAVDPATAFRVFTDDISTWWIGGPRLFQWRGTNFADDQVTEVEVRFHARDGGTRVTVEHRGWEVLPLDHPARHGLDHGPFLRLMARSWAELLEAAKARAEGN